SLQVSSGSTLTNFVMTDASGTAYSTVGGADWASQNGFGDIIAMAAGNYSSGNTAANFGPGLNSSITGSFTATTNNTNSIRFNTNAALTVTLAAGATTITTGGILLGPGESGNDPVIAGPAGSTLTSTSNEMVVLTNVGRTVIIGVVATPTGAQLVD